MNMERKIQKEFQGRQIDYEEFLDLLSAFEHEKYSDGKNVVHVINYSGTNKTTVTLVSRKEIIEDETK